MKSNLISAKFVVVGGGVAGVCCVEELDALIEEQEDSCVEEASSSKFDYKIILISGTSGFLKVVTNTERKGQLIESFQIREKRTEEFLSKHIHIIQDDVTGWDATKQVLELLLSRAQTRVHYDKLCIATGARPKSSFTFHENVLTIRDTISVDQLCSKLAQGACRLLLIGNGGIATELVFELEDIGEIVWVIRDSTISAVYFDEVAAKFFMPKLDVGRGGEAEPKPEVKQKRYTVSTHSNTINDKKRVGCDVESSDKGNLNCAESTNLGLNRSAGCALGPHWLAELKQKCAQKKRRISVLNNTEVVNIYSREEYLKCSSNDKSNCDIAKNVEFNDETGNAWPMFAVLSSGEVMGFDFAIEASGVVPNSIFWVTQCSKLKIAEDNGISVDNLMRTSLPNVFAAGDVCTLSNTEDKPHWKQIRLWTQARQMGIFAARCMIVEDILPDICFDLFTHVTTFFGYKVVLLGDFSASKLQKPYDLHYRITNNSNDDSNKDNNSEYIKVITKDSKVQGAVLIGKTDLEEAIENLILNQIDISQIEESLLDPQVDLDDYFD